MEEDKNKESRGKPKAESGKQETSQQPAAGSERSVSTETPAVSLQPETTLQTSSNKPETENMEVHKHPHHVTHKKKWGEYFLEFLMIFLAVFLGFLAENFREHQVEKERGKQYIESFYNDLEKD